LFKVNINPPEFLDLEDIVEPGGDGRHSSREHVIAVIRFLWTNGCLLGYTGALAQ
jgi:hypothetical protein